MSAADIKQITDLVALLNVAFADSTVPDLYIEEANIRLANGAGYRVGVLTFSDEQFMFSPDTYGDEVAS